MFLKTIPFSSGNGIEIAKNSTGLYASPDGWGIAFYSSRPIVLPWQHIALTWDVTLGTGSNLQFYINGVLDTGASGRRAFTATDTGDWFLGQDFSGAPGEFFSRAYFGRMADFAVYSNALSARTVEWIYSNGVEGALSPLPPDPNADPDEDGHKNWQEEIAGTDPDDPDSVLKISAVVPYGTELVSCLVTDPVGEVFWAEWVPAEHTIVSWPSVTGRLYDLDGASNQFFRFVPIASNLAATPPVNTYTNPLSPLDFEFYRISVRKVAP
jgi:hypothetical protein